MKYYPRIVDEMLSFRLETKGAVLVVGSKWCGKSTTSLKKANSVIYMQDSQNRDKYIFKSKSSSDD